MTELTRNVELTADQTSQVATAMEEMNSTVLEVARSENDAEGDLPGAAAAGSIVVLS